MYNYFKLYAWIIHCFGNSEFNAKDFKKTFESAQHAKVLHDLTKLGFLKRMKRGVYVALKPQQMTEDIVKRNHGDMSLIESVKNRKYAFSHDNAVRIWTNGKSHGRITKGYLPIHLRILDKDVSWWENLFQKHDAEYCLADKNRTLFGVVYILHPKPSFKTVIKHNMPVIPKTEVVEFCKQNGEHYESALKHII
ncbi:MAG: hypothetical protein V1921_08210 [Candidatus Altiarchaeota archaeon]